MGDDETIKRIIDEGKNRSEVWERLKYLTSEIGPRLTGSSRALKANQWCMAEYEKWGLTDAHIEQWGTIGTGFDRGPSTGKLFLKQEARAERPGGRNRPTGAGGGNGAAASERPGAAIKPADADKPTAPPVPAADAKPADAAPAAPVADAKPAEQPAEEPKVTYEPLRDVQFTTMSWTAGTNGAVRGIVLKEPKTEEEFEKVKDKLAGAWILIDAVTPAGQRGFRSPLAMRYDLRAAAHRKADGVPEPVAAPKPGEEPKEPPKAADGSKVDDAKDKPSRSPSDSPCCRSPGTSAPRAMNWSSRVARPGGGPLTQTRSLRMSISSSPAPTTTR